MFYEEDKIEFRNVIVAFAEQMDVFGETDDLLKKLGLTTVPELKKLTVDEFILAILKVKLLLNQDSNTPEIFLSNLLP